VNKEIKLAWSHTEDYFNCDSMEEVISDQGLLAGDTIYFGEQRTPKSVWIDADEVIERIQEAAYEECGEWAEDYPKVDDQAKAELDALLTAWQEKYCTPSFYLVHNIQEYVVTEEDVISAS
jgi:hypothetical protein